MLKPRKSHTRKQRLVNVPTKAPFAFEKGTNKAKKNRPRIGPPMTLFIKYDFAHFVFNFFLLTYN